MTKILAHGFLHYLGTLFIILKSYHIGHSLRNTNLISAVREWLIRDGPFIKNFCLIDFFVIQKTWPKFDNF